MAKVLSSVNLTAGVISTIPLGLNPDQVQAVRLTNESPYALQVYTPTDAVWLGAWMEDIYRYDGSGNLLVLTPVVVTTQSNPPSTVALITVYDMSDTVPDGSWPLALGRQMEIGNTASVNIGSSGTVNIGNSPTVNIGNSPSVSIANTPNVAITSGSVTIASGTVNIANALTTTTQASFLTANRSASGTTSVSFTITHANGLATYIQGWDVSSTKSATNTDGLLSFTGWLGNSPSYELTCSTSVGCFAEKTFPHAIPGPVNGDITINFTPNAAWGTFEINIYYYQA